MLANGMLGTGSPLIRGGRNLLHAFYTATGISPEGSALYLMDDGSGSTLTDHSGNGHHGTLAAGAAAPAWVETGLQFDGVDDAVTLPFEIPNGPFTVLSVIKPLVSMTGFRTFVSNRAAPTPIRCSLGFVDDLPRFYTRTDASNLSLVTAGANITPGTRYFMGGVRRAASVSIYLGSTQTSAAATFGATTAGTTTLGKRSDANVYHTNAIISSIAMFSRELTHEDILAAKTWFDARDGIII